MSWSEILLDETTLTDEEILQLIRDVTTPKETTR